MPDFEPFMAVFHQYRREQSEQEVHQYMHKGLCNIRENPLNVEIVQKMFDFELDIGEIKKEFSLLKKSWKLSLISRTFLSN